MLAPNIKDLLQSFTTLKQKLSIRTGAQLLDQNIRIEDHVVYVKEGIDDLSKALPSFELCTLLIMTVNARG